MSLTSNWIDSSRTMVLWAQKSLLQLALHLDFLFMNICQQSDAWILLCPCLVCRLCRSFLLVEDPTKQLVLKKIQSITNSMSGLLNTFNLILKNIFVLFALNFFLSMSMGSKRAVSALAKITLF